MKKTSLIVSTLCCAALVCGCGSKHGPGAAPTPDKVIQPEPIQGSTGQYMSPYKADGQLTPWIQALIKVTPPPSIYVRDERPRAKDDHARQAEEAQRQAEAVRSAGGQDAIRAQSDLSFSSADDLCVYLYAKHSRQAGYGDVFDALNQIYPDMRKRCRAAIQKAMSGQQCSDGPGGGGGEGPGGGGHGGGGPGGGGGMGGGGRGGGWGGF